LPPPRAAAPLRPPLPPQLPPPLHAAVRRRQLRRRRTQRCPWRQKPWCGGWRRRRGRQRLGAVRLGWRGCRCRRRRRRPPPSACRCRSTAVASANWTHSGFYIPKNTSNLKLRALEDEALLFKREPSFSRILALNSSRCIDLQYDSLACEAIGTYLRSWWLR